MGASRCVFEHVSGWAVVKQHRIQEDEMEKRMESERLHVKLDETGRLVESSYLPLLESRIEPVPTPITAGAAPMTASFKINEEGFIFDASPENLNGHKVILHGRSSSPLGRTDAVSPKCTWVPDGKGGWTCV